MMPHFRKRLVNEALQLSRRLSSALPGRTRDNEWLKTNTKAYIVEAKSDLAEARQLQDEPKTRGILSAFTTKLLLITGNTRACSCHSDHDWEGCLCYLQYVYHLHGAYDRYRLDANGRGSTDAELAEFVEDRVRKQLNTSAITMTSGIKF